MKTKAYVNGRIVSAKDAVVSIFDRGLNYGDGVFETLKAERGAVQFKKEHIARLCKNAAYIGIKKSDFQGLIDDIENNAIEKIIKQSRLSNSSAHVRITLTRGLDLSGHLPTANLSPTAIIAVKPLDERVLNVIREYGATAIILKTLPGAMPSIKTLNFLQNVLGKAEATDRKAYEGLFTSARFVTEGTASNLFVVKNNVIKTHPANGHVLPGIMRAAVIQLARKNKLAMQESAVTVESLSVADEAFLTNSIIGIVPLVAISGKRLANGRPGQTTMFLQAALSSSF